MPQKELDSSSWNRAVEQINNSRRKLTVSRVRVPDSMFPDGYKELLNLYSESKVTLTDTAWDLLYQAHHLATTDGSFTVIPEHVIIAAGQTQDPELDHALGLNEGERDECIMLFDGIIESLHNTDRTPLRKFAGMNPTPTSSQAPFMHSEVLHAIGRAHSIAEKNGRGVSGADLLDSIMGNR